MKLSTESYKGVRDFFPEDWEIMQYIFTSLRNTLHHFGYQEYNASPLEPAELYLSKTSDEIVNEQTYTFTDRGGRAVTLRPEMTPTVSRMIASRAKALSMPVRWFSIPNVFRYEKPQRGRLREHYQLNVDMFGSTAEDADIEIVHLAHNILKNFGAKDEDFKIRINSRMLINAYFEHVLFADETLTKHLMRLADKKDKMPLEQFKVLATDIFAQSTKNEHKKTPDDFVQAYIDFFDGKIDNVKNNELVQQYRSQIENILTTTKQLGITNVVFDPTIIRGFDYYTGIVFEVHDTDPTNTRSIFGGGRYDGLTGLFTNEVIPAIGFGAGDVTLRDFLETHALLKPIQKQADVYIVRAGTTYTEANTVADILRNNGLSVITDISGKKIGDQIRRADKDHIPYIIVIGEKEISSQVYEIKSLRDSTTTQGNIQEIITYIHNK